MNKKTLALVLACLALPVMADENKPPENFVLVKPTDLEALRKQAQTGLTQSQNDNLRRFYTAFALAGILAGPGEPGDPVDRAFDIGTRAMERELKPKKK